MDTLTQETRKHLIEKAISYAISIELHNDISQSIDMAIKDMKDTDSWEEEQIKEMKEYLDSKEDQIQIAFDNLEELKETFATLISY